MRRCRGRAGVIVVIVLCVVLFIVCVLLCAKAEPYEDETDVEAEDDSGTQNVQGR